MTAWKCVRAERPGRLWRVVIVTVIVVMSLWGVTGCEGGDDQGGTEQADLDLEVGIREEAYVGGAVITVEALQSAFQPVSPSQKLSDETLEAPAEGESFYQAYVMVENDGSVPVRVDPEDFVCRIGNVVTTLEPTRSGPMPRSLISGTSLNLLITFRGQAGIEPVLIYDPPWYDGLIYFSASFEGGSATTTTQAALIDDTSTTTVVGQ